MYPHKKSISTHLFFLCISYQPFWESVMIYILIYLFILCLQIQGPCL